MANKFEVQVVASDKFSATFKQLNKTAAGAVRPLANAGRQVGTFTRSLQLETITHGMGSVSRASVAVARDIGAISSPIASLVGSGLTGGIVGVAAAVIGLGAAWTRLGFGIDRTATAIGVSTRDLQLFRGAAGLAGVSTEAMDGALQGLGSTLHRALWGDSTALAVLQKLHIGMKLAKDGTPDLVASMNDVADAMVRVSDPYTRMSIARALGIPEEAIPLLLKGAAGIKALREEQERLGIASDDSIAKAKAFETSIYRLQAASNALAMTLGETLIPWLTKSVDALNRQILTTKKGSYADFLTRFGEGIAAVFGRTALKVPPLAGAVAAGKVAGMITGHTGGGVQLTKDAQARAARDPWVPSAPRVPAAPAAAPGVPADPSKASPADPATPARNAAAEMAAKRAFLARLEVERNLPPGMLYGVWGTESSWGKNAVKSSAGAEGDFQFMPGTAKRYNVHIGDWESEARGAADYLSDLRAQKGSFRGALMAYNGVKDNIAAGEKYVADVDRNAGTSPLKVELQITGAPPGMTAQARVGPATVPVRVVEAMPTHATP